MVWAYLGLIETNTITAFALSGSNPASVEFLEYEYPPPTLSITSPANGGIYLLGSNQGLNITVNVQASPETSVDVTYSYQTSSGGADTTLGVVPSSPYSFTWTNNLWWTNAFIGQYTVSAVAEDNLGGVSEPQNVTFTIALDSDGIGIPDYWQLEYFGYVGVNPDSSPDGNGQTLLYDYQNGLNPTDYYDGMLPRLAVLSGNAQGGNYNSFLPQPVVIQVKDYYSAILTNAPITFTVTNGTALLAAATNETPSSSVSVKTDTNGQAVAWVYFPAAATNPPDSTIVASAFSGTNSTAIVVNEFVPLGHWTFNNTNTWIGQEGQLPLLATNVVGVTSWSSNAILTESASLALISYHVIETNGSTNITCQTGSTSFWFQPWWSSTNAGGTGPGTWGRLLEMGSNNFNLSTNTWMAGATNGWWSLYLNPSGTELSFGTSTNGYGSLNLTAGISWISNEWYQITLTYSPTNTALYVDGQLLTNGSGITAHPNSSELTNGFRIGSDEYGNNQAKGAFDELETFNYPLGSTNSATYSSAIPDWWVVQYFGTVDKTGATVDGNGATLLFDFQAGINPDFITFSIAVTNVYVNTNAATLPLNVTWGTPAYIAVLVDTNSITTFTNDPAYNTNNSVNFSNATWLPYSTAIAYLNSGDGTYSVWIGLRSDSQGIPPTWEVQRLVLDTMPPHLTITNPASVVSQPMIQVQGYASKPLSGLTFDVSNATVVLSNQIGYIIGQFADTNLIEITTNYFQCYDINLTTNSATQVSVHATDLAGNTTSTNISITLNYSGDTNPPVLTVLWPQDGTEISGTQFTFEGQVENPTATVSASIVDISGNTNTAQGVVERSGLVWVPNLPLGEGENTLTVNVTDAAGSISTTSLTLYRSSVVVAMNPVSGYQLNHPPVNVSGTISDSSYTVTVNGVTATVNSNGTWDAANVPITAGEKTTFDVEVTGPSDPAQYFTQTPPVNVVLTSYTCDYAYYTPNTTGLFGSIAWHPGSSALEPFGPAYAIGWNKINWSNRVVLMRAFRILAGMMILLLTLNFHTQHRFIRCGTQIFQGDRGIQSGMGIQPGQGYSDPSRDSTIRRFGTWSWRPIWYRRKRRRKMTPKHQSLRHRYPLEMSRLRRIPIATTRSGERCIQAPAGASPDVTPSAGACSFDVQAQQLQFQLAVDINRTGHIPLDGGGVTTPSSPYRFWINDSKENGDDETGEGGTGDQIPGSANPNYSLDFPNGRSDYVNYFPIVISLGNTLQLLPLSAGYEYKLYQADGAVKIIYTSLTPTNAFDYLTNSGAPTNYFQVDNSTTDNPAYGQLDSGPLFEADSINIGSDATGYLLNTNFLGLVESNGGNGVILVEGTNKYCATLNPRDLER